MASPRAYIKPSGFAMNVVNPFAIKFGFASSMVVRGRYSGQLREVAVAPVTHGGIRYLVSLHGESDWVQNLRLARTCELHCHGLLERIRGIETFGSVRDSVIATYRAKLGKAVDPYFRAYPDSRDHPVFRVEILTMQTQPLRPRRQP
ncbi:MAG: nitroreductase family deazaflavin-dependent oxidoreductase [Thermomicrobiales bacterium]